ncbi:hypothetical protein Pan216_13350 [Planctomycetes bacterium Pan216]|uniref:Uncharacterized protein n=1 Tax=Kolteria novifilia TaxID=2527975 RepID=A0A518B0L0_9BACT|nr:hypothetical protein Pan216_13350 [Planctomycetes bacterium Pan216]
MPKSVTVCDETMTGNMLHQRTIDLPGHRITIRELIRNRVFQEVRDFNENQPDDYNGLVQPSDAEPTEGGCRLRIPRKINWRQQYERAVSAFRSKQILIVVDDRQVDSLHDEVRITADTRVSFFRLAPLVAG